ncbi:MAG: hypothetical protein CSA76_05745 [Spirochaetales bacterium]|nr:MAG: hypothetical protein CSA76_05745 [Spirochaetales bacterium]
MQPAEEDDESIETLIHIHTTGILPGMDSGAEGILFDDEIPVISWTSEGLDYDRYLRGFKRGPTGVYKSLMSLSREYNAVCAVLMVGSRKGLETDYAVGLDDESASHLSVTRNEAVWDEWFAKRQVVFVPSLAQSLYAEKIRYSEFMFVRSGMFIPALYLGTEACVFLGFKDVPADPASLLQQMATTA